MEGFSLERLCYQFGHTISDLWHGALVDENDGEQPARIVDAFAAVKTKLVILFVDRLGRIC